MIFFLLEQARKILTFITVSSDS